MISSFFKNLFFKSKNNPKRYSKNEKLSQSIELLITELGNSLISCDICMRGDNVSIAGYNTQTSITDMFAEISEFFHYALDISNFPTMGNYFVLNLKNDFSILILDIKDYQWLILLNTENLDMGSTLTRVVPKLKQIFDPSIVIEADCDSEEVKENNINNMEIQSKLKDNLEPKILDLDNDNSFQFKLNETILNKQLTELEKKGIKEEKQQVPIMTPNFNEKKMTVLEILKQQNQVKKETVNVMEILK